MAEAKPTPGPLVVRAIAPNEYAIDAPGGDPTLGYTKWSALAIVYGSDFASAGDDVARLNALRFAAAPDLLCAAAHAVMEWRLHGSLTDSCRVLEAAIAKAEGR